jgi:sterol carrier protein 2
MSKPVFVVGVGMTHFEKPGTRDWDYPEIGEEAGKAALEDAGIPFDEIDQAAVGYVYGESTCGQRAIYNLGLTGLPIYNVNNNCSTGSTALYLIKQLIEGGVIEVGLALGFEKMGRGSLGATYTDRIHPTADHFERMVELCGYGKAPAAPQLFGNAAKAHMQRFGSTPEQFAQVAVKNHAHSVNNPRAQFRQAHSLEDVMNAEMIFEPLTKLQCCPTSEGGAAAVLCSEEVVIRHGLEDRAVQIASMSMTTDLTPPKGQEILSLVGFDMSRDAARKAYRDASIQAEDIDVIELHDCFSANELITYEALGLCDVGQGGELVAAGEVTYGGSWVVNPSGGLIAKGHPLGATGLAQCAEICTQLRGASGARQVDGASVGLAHNLGLGGAAFVSIFRK